MGLYRKKPVVIEAFKWTADELQTDDPEWIIEGLKKPWGEGAVRFSKTGTPDCTMQIFTLEGEHTAQRGDYIIKGIAGELYPCKPDIFEKTYDKVE